MHRYEGSQPEIVLDLAVHDSTLQFEPDWSLDADAARLRTSSALSSDALLLGRSFLPSVIDTGGNACCQGVKIGARNGVGGDHVYHYVFDGISHLDPVVADELKGLPIFEVHAEYLDILEWLHNPIEGAIVHHIIRNAGSFAGDIGAMSYFQYWLEQDVGQRSRPDRCLESLKRLLLFLDTR
jgi:hypothetical protein